MWPQLLNTINSKKICYRFKLIHNLEFGSTFPIDQDFYLSLTFQDLLQRTYLNQSLHWYKKSLANYYQRPEFELYDLKVDPEEVYNVASKPSYQEIFNELRSAIIEWQKAQCSKIGKKCNFKTTKTHYLHFQNWQKINFSTEKSPKIAFLVVLNFFLVQKLIFCHF